MLFIRALHIFDIRKISSNVILDESKFPTKLVGSQRNKFKSINYVCEIALEKANLQCKLVVEKTGRWA